MIRSIAFATAALALIAGAAQAETFKVSTQGLDLSAPAGAKAFYSRLRREAVAACGGAPTQFFTTEQQRFDACFKAAVDAGVAQVHAPLVSALNGQAPTMLASAGR